MAEAGPDGVGDEGADAVDEDHEDPRGTMTLLLLFLALIVVLWVWSYYALVSRG